MSVPARKSEMAAAAFGPAKSNRIPRAKKTMSIGVVLKRINEEFPEVTVSKIRFLESEGLISPSRTSSGYRRYTEDDVNRLRYILVTQRDHYLPLKVIREQLEAIDSGEVASIMSASSSTPVVSPENFRDPAPVRLSDADLASGAGTNDGLVAECIKLGLIAPDPAGYFTADDMAIVSTVVRLTEAGLESRHLKSLKNAAVRQSDIVEQVTRPYALAKDETARHRANEKQQEIAALVVSLHATLLKNALRG